MVFGCAGRVGIFGSTFPSIPEGNDKPNLEKMSNAKEAIIFYLEGLEKVNQIKLKPKSVIKEIEVHV